MELLFHCTLRPSELPSPNCKSTKTNPGTDGRRMISLLAVILPYSHSETGPKNMSLSSQTINRLTCLSTWLRTGSMTLKARRSKSTPTPSDQHDFNSHQHHFNLTGKENSIVLPWYSHCQTIITIKLILTL